MTNASFDPETIDVLAPNFKKRWSGVSSTVFALVPLQAKALPIAAVGPNLPEYLPQMSWARTLRLGRQKRRVWHARRNNEMLFGLLLKFVLRQNIKLLFTSASQRVHSRYTKWLISKMDWVVATSEKGAKYLDVPHEVVMHGVDLDLFTPAQDKIALRRDLGLPEHQKLVGCFGRVRHQKGTDVFVDAMLRLMEKHPDAMGIILGQATQKHQGFEQNLKDKVAQAGYADRIRFLGVKPYEETAKFYAALDVFCAPQRWEGFGLTPLEAMAAGTPVVATKVGAFEELVVDGETGFIVETGSVEAMAKNLGHLLSQPKTREAFAQNAHQHVSAHFDLGGEAKKLLEIYNRLLRSDQDTR